MSRPRPLRQSRSPIVRALARDSVSTLVRRVISTVETANVDECREGLYWYARAQEIAREVGASCNLGGSPDETLATGAGILAALSPGAPWTRNVPDAYAMAQGNHGHPFATYRANVEKAAGIAGGDNPDRVLGGCKVRAFYRCILDPLRADCACIDRHALAVLYGGPLTDQARSTFAGSPRLYARAEGAYILAARHLGIAPPQAQAIAWCAYRRTAGISV